MKKLTNLSKILIAVVLILALIVVTFVFWYSSSLKAVSSDAKKQEFVVDKTDTFSTLGKKLEDEKLIKSEIAYKIYIKLNKISSLKAGTYNLSPSMSVGEIIEKLEQGSNYDPDVINVTFREGLSMMQMAKIIVEKTDNLEDNVYNILKDTTYLKELIKEYWFLTDDILDSRIYYPLEGYLFPDTYQLKSNMEVKQIFKIMLDNLDRKITPYKEEIEKNKYSIHQIITLASMIQSEGNNIDDFKKMASVFLTRLDRKMQLQSCASAYYGDKKIMGVDAFGDANQKSNNYNTYVIPALPVGAISNPGIDAITAVLNPTNTNYLYFASDKSMKVYFSSTYEEHLNIVAMLKESGNWYGS